MIVHLVGCIYVDMMTFDVHVDTWHDVSLHSIHFRFIGLMHLCAYHITRIACFLCCMLLGE